MPSRFLFEYCHRENEKDSQIYINKQTNKRKECLLQALVLQLLQGIQIDPPTRETRIFIFYFKKIVLDKIMGDEFMGSELNWNLMIEPDF